MYISMWPHMRKRGFSMKTAKLVIGIISCVLFLLIMFQSCAATVVEAMGDSEGLSGGAGVLTGIFMLVAGIVGIATHKAGRGGGTVTCIVFYVLAGLIGVFMHGIYEDLVIWGILCLVFALVHIFFQFKGERTVKGNLS